jgi:hypothetical protein
MQVKAYSALQRWAALNTYNNTRISRPLKLVKKISASFGLRSKHEPAYRRPGKKCHTSLLKLIVS